MVRAPPQPDPQVQRDAQIALEREREREREKDRREAEERKREAEERRQAQLEREREQRRKLEAQKKREEEQARRKEEEAKQLAEAKRKEAERRKREQEQAAREAREAQRVARLREENLRRMQGLAGGTGSPDSTGTAARSSGPSASYAGKVAAIIKRNTRFVETVAGDPPVEVEIRLAPDGTIVGQRLVKSSGNKARDAAVMRGIQATERLPRDTDGRIHTPMLISVRQFG